MKKAVISLLVFFTLLTTSCIGGYFVTNYTTTYTPVYRTMKDIRESFGVHTEREIPGPGKILLYENYLLLSEGNVGIHILELSDPTQPEYLGFLEIPGNFDMAVREGLLYADSFMDLILIDLKGLPDLETLNIKERIEDVLDYDPYRNMGPIIHDNRAGLFTYVEDIDPEKGIVVDWETQVTSSRQWIPYGAHLSSPGESLALGKSGSLSKFALTADRFYALDARGIRTFSFTEDLGLQLESSVQVSQENSEIETLFPYQDNLFIGSQRGVYLYSLEDPDQPVKRSFFPHVTSRDPVVVANDLAYSTIFWGGLSIIDYQDRDDPQLILEVDLPNPMGLSLDFPHLFVATDRGIAILDVTQPEQVTLNFHQDAPLEGGFEVIAHQEILYVVAEEGISLMSYQEIDQLQSMGFIPFSGAHQE